MDRRHFLSRPRPAAPAPVASPPFEVLPGQVVDGGPVQWRYRAARPVRSSEASGPGREPLATDARLAPFVPSAEAPWDGRRIRHLLRRAGLAAPVETVAAFAEMTPAAAVDALVDGLLARPDDPEPLWIDDAPPHWSAPRDVLDAYWDRNWERNYDAMIGTVTEATGSPALAPLDDAVRSFDLRLRMMWHSHFVTHLESYALAPWLARYWARLGRHGLGDVRAFVRAIGTDPAMLVYLNGVENRVWAPNENYARELLELFTMGIFGPDGEPNYTQTDVTEIARALTGYGLDYYGTTATPLEAVFVPDWHDGGDKTVFGRTGPWGHDDVVDLIFEERAPQVAHWIASLLYREFVYEAPHPDVVAAMADLLIASDWRLAPVVRALLGSEHFFSDVALGARVRSPFEHHVAAHRELGTVSDREFKQALHWLMGLCGQHLFEPPTVAGWPGGRDWLDTSRLTQRWLYSSWLIWRPRYRDLAARMPTPWDAAALAADLADALLGAPLSDADAAALTPILLNGIPAYEWNPLVEGAESRIRGLVGHLLRQPEFQLA